MAEADGIRLIAGLGNPGLEYQQTRHNAGFWFVDALIRAVGGQFYAEPKFNGQVGRIVADDRDLWLFKPGAFMNRSGQPLRSISAFYKIPMPNILVVHDEIDLPPGVVRLKWGGGHGGHNGLRDIFAHLGQDFWRLRLGVGHPGHRHRVVDYLTSSRPGNEEQQAILDGVANALAIIPWLVAGEFEKAQQQLHTRQRA
ncbi:MAG TPA: aminoacyl-tRNA hydrolase [Gammaproteobacteria bacterium]|nr:aminoacyl-tRNA hydrolase [Gammaproteobacteria bacterium]